jgi:L-lysine 2,3-aminomutase
MELKDLKQEAVEVGIKDFYSYARNFFLDTNGFQTSVIPENKKQSLEELISKTASCLGVDKKNLWTTPAFHMAFRITDLNSLMSLGENFDQDNLSSSLKIGREMSILPLNVLLGGSTMKKFIPSLPKLYSNEQVHSLDPYGIFREQDQIKAIDRNGVSRYLGSRKFDYAVLENLTEFCPVGCAECYKGTLTRLTMSALADLDPKYADLKRQLNFQEQRAIEQTELLRKWLDKHSEVDTVILSGGEPLVYSDNTIKSILDELGQAKHVRAVRICTSAPYQGLFYRITDNLIDKLSEFRRKNDGKNGRLKKQLYFNCHVTDEDQLSTPEARIATEKLQEAGISVHLQLPLQEGINFYRDDLKKSAEKLKRICKSAYEIGAIPYKAIVNMHSPSYKELTVPIERVSEAITFLDQHFHTSDMARWQAFNILHEEGNAYIYPKPNFVAEKDIDRNRQRVTYFLPKIDSNNEISVHTYEEPLIAGINDRDSLPKINDDSISLKINEVRGGYQRLRTNQIDTREFYRVSGIRFSDNEPLMID